MSLSLRVPPPPPAALPPLPPSSPRAGHHHQEPGFVSTEILERWLGMDDCMLDDGPLLQDGGDEASRAPGIEEQLSGRPPAPPVARACVAGDEHLRWQVAGLIVHSLPCLSLAPEGVRRGLVGALHDPRM